MALQLYYMPGSASCRLVLLVAAALNLQFDTMVNLVSVGKKPPIPEDVRARLGIPEDERPVDERPLDGSSGRDGMNRIIPWEMKDLSMLNPQSTVPTIVDDGFVLWESRAISRYLVNKYGADSTLYPADLQTRAKIDQLLDFDLGTLYPRFSRYLFPQVFGSAPADEGLLNKLQEALGFLNSFLEGQSYAVGSDITLADLSLVSTVSTIDAARIDLEPYANILKWYILVKSTAPGYYSANENGIEAFRMLRQISKVVVENTEDKNAGGYLAQMTSLAFLRGNISGPFYTMPEYRDDHGLF